MKEIVSAALPDLESVFKIYYLDEDEDEICLSDKEDFKACQEYAKQKGDKIKLIIKSDAAHPTQATVDEETKTVEESQETEIRYELVEEVEEEEVNLPSEQSKIISEEDKKRVLDLLQADSDSENSDPKFSQCVSEGASEKKNSAVAEEESKVDVISDKEVSEAQNLQRSVASFEIHHLKEEIQVEVPEGEQIEEFEEDERDKSGSNVQAIKFDRDAEDVGFIKKTWNSLLFKAGKENIRLELASVMEQKLDEEFSQDYIITAKPGQTIKKRWMVKNKGKISWPVDSQIVCLDDKADCIVPALDFILAPREMLEMSVKIKISEEKVENHIEQFVFRFFSERSGYFGEPMVCTVEVTPEVMMPQEDKLKEILTGSDDTNPILLEIANDFVSEGLGTFEQCLEALKDCKANF